MKDVLKCAGLLLVGLFVAVIGYPFLHEFGHSVAAVSVGAKVLEFNLLPSPYVVCDVSGINALKQSIIGFGGIIVPFVSAAVIKTEKFWIWYAAFLVKGISVYAFILSFAAAILYSCGISAVNEDIVQILKLLPDMLWIIVALLGLIIVGGIILLKREKPFSRCLGYFDIKQNKSSKIINKG